MAKNIDFKELFQVSHQAKSKQKAAMNRSNKRMFEGEGEFNFQNFHLTLFKMSSFKQIIVQYTRTHTTCTHKTVWPIKEKSKTVNRNLCEAAQILDLIKIFKFNNHKYVQ